MTPLQLSAQQEQDALRLKHLLEEKFQQQLLQIARLLVSKNDSELFGKTEFELRDQVHQLGATALETVLEERKKGGT